MLSYDELIERNRSLEAERTKLETDRRALEALLRAEQDRARTEREKRERLEEENGFALRQLEELRKSYAILQQQYELLRRKIFEAKAERVDSTQLEMEFENTKAALDEMQQRLEEAAAAAGEPGTASPESRPPRPKPTGRRKLDASLLPVERVVIADRRWKRSC